MAIPATCITVIDEAQGSGADSVFDAEWDAFRSAWPQRVFYLLDPGGGGFGRIPPAFSADPLAFGPIAVARDGGNAANRSDWFAICGLNSRPAGSLVSLAVDTSGSMTLNTVRASYDYFIQRCANAGFTLVVDTTFPNERWAPPHNKSISPSGSISFSPSTISATGSSTMTWVTSGEVTSVSIDQGIGSVTDSGSLVVTPGPPGGRTVTYTLSIIGAIGGTVTTSATLTLLPTPTIGSFIATPNPQTSGSFGVATSSVDLSWSTSNASSVSIDQGVGSVSLTGSTTVNTGLQSVAGSVSPATKTYTLTVIGVDGVTTITQDLTVSVYNDNDPGPFTIPNQTNLEPNTQYTIFVKTFSSSVIDMITSVSGTNGSQVSRNNSTWSSSITISPGDSVYVRFTTLPFNTDPSGLTASKTFGVIVGTRSANFDAITRAPDVNETFNLSNKSDNLPYPDIDTIPSPSPTQYITSDTLTLDDIELSDPYGVELKTNNSTAEVRVKKQGASTWGSWINTRSI